MPRLTPSHYNLFVPPLTNTTERVLTLVRRSLPWMLFTGAAALTLIWHERKLESLRIERDSAQQQVQWLLQQRTCVPSATTPVTLVLAASDPKTLQKQLMAAGMEIDTIRILLREQETKK